MPRWYVCVCVCLGLLRDFVSSVWNHEWHQIWIQMTQFSYWLCFTLRVAPSSPPGKWAEFGRITVPLILKFHLCKMGTTPKSVLSELLWASVREHVWKYFMKWKYIVIITPNNQNGPAHSALIMTPLFMTLVSLILLGLHTTHGSKVCCED